MVPETARGRIAVDETRVCLLQASDGTLSLPIEAGDETALECTQGTVINHLKRLAFREDFGEVVWTRMS